MLLITLFLFTLLTEDHLHLPTAHGAGATTTWCISKSGANQGTLQLALDYACGPGMADCGPIQAAGLCYLPNTLQAHASYAFNSFYQRSNAAPGACDFGGTAVVTVTDPSYGSCTYPSSSSSAGSTPTKPTPSTTPSTTPGTTPIVTPLSPPFGTGTGTGTGFGGFSPPDYSSANLKSIHTFLFMFLVILGTCLCIQSMSV